MSHETLGKAFVESSRRTGLKGFFRWKTTSKEEVYDHNFWGDRDGYFSAFSEDPSDPINSATATVLEKGKKYYVGLIHPGADDPKAGWSVKDNTGVEKIDFSPHHRYLTPDNPVVTFSSKGFRGEKVTFKLQELHNLPKPLQPGKRNVNLKTFSF